MESMTFDLVGCARCDGDGHPQITFEPLTLPVVDSEDKVLFTHWALCPTNGEPIMLVYWDEKVPTDV